MAITGIVHTKNEERRVLRALRSMQPFCDELLVVDMASTDATRELAAGFGARVLEVPDFGYVEPAWAIALEHVRTEWVLRIDADEIVPGPLGARLRAIVDGDEADLAMIGRTNFMFGDAVRATGWGPESDRHYFLFKRDWRESGDASTPIHTVLQPRPGARVVDLPNTPDFTVWHFNYLDWQHFVEKLNRYTTVEAEALQGARPTIRGLGRELAEQLLWRGLRRRAWLDGHRGIGLLWMMLTYRILVFLKARQLAAHGDADAIERHYDALADRATGAGRRLERR